MAAQLFQQYAGAPEEHARIPIEVAGGYVSPGGGERRLLPKALHLHRRQRALGEVLGELDIPITGFRPARLDSHHHQAPFGRAAKRRLQYFAIRRRFGDYMVGGKHAHDRFRIERIQDLRRQTDGRRRVALHRLGQNLSFRNLGKLAHNGVAQVSVGQHPDMFRRDQRGQAVYGGLDQRPFPDHVQNLLGGALAASRPETRAASSGQNQSIMMRTG
jgi:hypothetical protein